MDWFLIFQLSCTKDFAGSWGKTGEDVHGWKARMQTACLTRQETPGEDTFFLSSLYAYEYMGAPVNAVMYHDKPDSYLQREKFGLGTPMHDAAAVGDVEVVRILLDTWRRPPHPRQSRAPGT